MFIRGHTWHFVYLEKYFLFFYYWIFANYLRIVRLEIKIIEHLGLVPVLCTPLILKVSNLTLLMN